MAFRALVGALAAVGCVFGGSPAAVAGRGDAPAALRSLGVKVLAQRREPELRRLLASLDAADYPDAADISVEIQQLLQWPVPRCVQQAVVAHLPLLRVLKLLLVDFLVMLLVLLLLVLLVVFVFLLLVRLLVSLVLTRATVAQ